MKKIKEFLDEMDQKFEKIDWSFVLSIIFPFMFLFKKKKTNTINGHIIQVPTQTLRFRVKKDISAFNRLYADKVDSGISGEMIKRTMINELVEELIRANVIEFKKTNQFGSFGTSGTAGFPTDFDNRNLVEYLEAEIFVIKK
jgi:hypothetical protein